jgi:hypothetical protein
MCFLLFVYSPISFVVLFSFELHQTLYNCRRLQHVEIPCEGVHIDIRKTVTLKWIIGLLERG